MATGRQMVSCFVVTDDWTPKTLAEGTRYASYRLVEAAKLLKAGFLIWPTDVLVDGEPDRRNEVHFDVIVALEDVAREEFASRDKKIRAQATERLRPAFELLLGLLGEPQPL